MTAEKHIDQPASESTITVVYPQVVDTKSDKGDTVYSAFSKRQKTMIVVLVSIAGLFSSLSANIYFPALKVLEIDLHSDATMINLTVTAFMIAQAFAPTFWCCLADTWGRRPVYMMTILVYALACTGLALAPDYWSLLVLRLVQAVGCSAVVAIGSGTIGDIAVPAERGGYMGYFCLGTMLGPSIGPVLGGTLTQTLGWRSVFWFLTISSITLWLAIVFFLPETLRSLVGDGSGYSHPTPIQYIRRKRSKRTLDQDSAIITEEKKQPTSTAESHPFPPPLTAATRAAGWSKRLLSAFRNLKERDVFLVIGYNALQYAGNYCILTSLSDLFTVTYSLTEFQVGLCFLANGIGSISGSFVAGRLLNWRFRYIATRLGVSEDHAQRGKIDADFPIERARMDITWGWALLSNIVMLLYGWMLHIRAHIAVLLVLNFIVAHCSIGIANATSTLLVDLFPHSSATALASSNIVKCLLGALAVALVNPGISWLGVGWLFTLISGILLLSRILLVVELRYGSQWRKARNEKLAGSAS